MLKNTLLRLWCSILSLSVFSLNAQPTSPSDLWQVTTNSQSTVNNLNLQSNYSCYRNIVQRKYEVAGNVNNQVKYLKIVPKYMSKLLLHWITGYFKFWQDIYFYCKSTLVPKIDYCRIIVFIFSGGFCLFHDSTREKKQCSIDISLSITTNSDKVSCSCSSA